MQLDAMVEASNLKGIWCMKSPKHVISDTGRVDILSADNSAGHGSGFDDAIFDELGLLKEKDRELVAGMRSSVSAKGGRFIALSIQGDAPFTREMLERRGQDGLVIHHYAAPDDCDLDDPEAWEAANPGISAGIKQRPYMEHAARVALTTPAEAASFRAFDLNQPQDINAQHLVLAQDWQRLEAEPQDLPAKEGPLILGVDLSSGYAMSAAVAYWPKTKRLEGFCAFPDNPSLRERGMADGGWFAI